MNIAAVIGPQVSHAHTMLAAEALRAIARAAGHKLKIELHLPDGSIERLSKEDIAESDVVIIAGVEEQDLPRFRNRAIFKAQTTSLILRTSAVIDEALALAGVVHSCPTTHGAAGRDKTEEPYLVAVTACPTGIAHTFMAADALRKAAAKLGCQITVETQGSVGAARELTEDEILRADAVLIAADTHVNTDRFVGKRIFHASTKDALRDSVRLIENALALPEVEQSRQRVSAATPLAADAEAVTAAYRHLMTGVSYMLPLVTAGGLLIALSFLIGGVNAGDERGTLSWALMQIGGGTAFSLYVPVLAAFIAYSIAERPGLASGLVGGMLATTLGAGFIGGIIAGFLAGYTTKFLNDKIALPEVLSGLKPVLILPVLSTLAVGLAMIFLVGAPAKTILESLTTWLDNMQQSGAMALGLLLGVMMALDMGGPINKAAYGFSVALLASNVSGPMAATMAAGMTPPLGIALATALAPNCFTQEERSAGKAAAILGVSFITEGAIPFAAKDPFRVIPCLALGSATAGALAMAFNVHLMVPHGGVFALLIPHAVDRLSMYLVAILVGTLVTAAAFVLLRRMSTHKSLLRNVSDK